MAQILDPLSGDDSSTALLCSYVNRTPQVQIARITNIENWYFERVVFPGQNLLFEAPQAAQLEIHTGMMASAILSDSIACVKLVVQDPPPDDLFAPQSRPHGNTNQAPDEQAHAA